MENSVQQPFKILVYGNNLDAWLTIASLQVLLELQIRKGLVEVQMLLPAQKSWSECVVGHPNDKALFQLLRVSEADLFSHCDAQFSLGNGYRSQAGNAEGFHSFGACGFSYQGLAFSQLWMRLRQTSEAAPFYHEFSPAAVCAQFGRFCHPPADTKNLLATMDYALNFNASKLVELLRARFNKLHLYEGEVADLLVNNKTDLQVSAIRTQAGEELAADLFLDVSEERTLQRKLDTRGKVESLGHINLFHAVAKVEKNAASSSSSQKVGALWLSQSDLHKTRCFSAYSEAGFEEETCLDLWQQHSESRLEPQGSVKWQLESVSKAWVGNVLSVGRSLYRFPLLALSPVFLLHRQIQQFVTLLPLAMDQHLCAAEYNRFYSCFINNIFEVYELHKLSPLDGPMVGNNLEKVCSPDLVHRLNLFTERARVSFDPHALLRDDEWTSLLLALNVQPLACDPLVDKFDFSELQKKLLVGAATLKKMAMQVPPIDVYRAGMMEHLQARH